VLTEEVLDEIGARFGTFGLQLSGTISSRCAGSENNNMKND
jgi:hypothetical protein